MPFISKKKFEQLNQNVSDMNDRLAQQEHDLRKKINLIGTLKADMLHLQEANEQLLRITQPINNAVISFVIQPDLKVGMSFNTPANVVSALVEQDYLPEELKNDEHAINAAMLLVANELTEQYITSINGELPDED